MNSPQVAQELSRPRESTVTRRRFLAQSAAGAAGLALAPVGLAREVRGAADKTVAAVVTIYIPGSHSDVLVGKILQGWSQDGGVGPRLKLSSIYVDQFPEGDLARPLAAKHGFRLSSTVEDALTLGGKGLAVDGVLLIGEHGDYPWNEKQQHLYPRRRLLTDIANTFERTGQVAPVFHDKHLGPVWDDALWMYQRVRELKVPFMAGSSIPVSFRRPNIAPEMGGPMAEVLAIGYSGLDIYGFHTLELLQCVAERRRGAESGVDWVRCLPGAELAKLLETGVIDRGLLEAVLSVTPHEAKPLSEADPREFAIFELGYRDGLRAHVLMLTGYARGISAGWRATPKSAPLAFLAEERTEPRYPHFARLLKGIERLFHTGRPAYPAERTLLTSGILDRALTSLHEGHRRLETPELRIAYQPVDYPHGDQIDLLADPS